MKKLLFVFALSLLLTAGVSAQVSKPFNIYAGGGLTLAQGDFGELYKNGFHGLGALGFNAAPMFQLLAKAEYHTFSIDVADMDASLNTILVGADLKLAPTLPASPIKPFGMAGAGFASTKAEATIDLGSFIPGAEIVGESDRQTDFYFEIGAGAEFSAGPSMALFAMVRYISIQSDGESTNFIPVTVGIKF